MISGGEQRLRGHVRLDVLDELQKERERLFALAVFISPRELGAQRDLDLVRQDFREGSAVSILERVVDTPDRADVLLGDRHDHRLADQQVLPATRSPSGGRRHGKFLRREHEGATTHRGQHAAPGHNRARPYASLC